MVKVTRENVHQFFNHVELQYPVKFAGGGHGTVPMPGWQCKECGWEGFYGFKGLPMRHSCAEVRKIRGRHIPEVRFS